MGTAGNKASRGINVRGGGATLGQVSVQALPPAGPPLVQTNVVGAVNNISSPTVTNFTARITPTLTNLRATSTNFRQLASPSPVFRNPSVRFIPPVLQRSSGQRSDQLLSVSHLQVSNNTFVPLNKNGISSLRPEIISLLDFKSVISDNAGSLTKAGRLLDLQFQAKALREKTLLDLVTNIRGGPGTGDFLDNVQSQFYTKFHAVDGLVDFYKNTIDAINNLKAAFDVKTIPNTAFNNTYFQTFNNFYATYMAFPGNSFLKFSNTKLLYQLMFDFRSILENYSIALLNLTDPTRTADQDPIRIDKSYTTQNGFSFTLDTVRSVGTAAQNATDDAFFVRFLHSLPPGIDDRVKLMVAILSKELRVSSGLGQSDVQTFLQTKFNFTPTANFPNPFPNVIGTVGDTALDAPAGNGSLSSLFFLDLTANSFVLPFETKYIDVNNTQKVYVPGSNFFVDSILNVTNNQFDTQPFIDYVQDVTNTLGNAMAIIQRLFDFKDTQSSLAGVEVFKKFLLAFRDSMQGLTTSAGDDLNKRNISIMSLFRMTTTDNQLKEMLFQYLVLLALKIQNDSRSDLRFITSHIVNEVNDLTGFSFVLLDPGTDPSLQNNRNLTPFLNQLATDIQNRVYQNVNAVQGTNITRPVTDPRVRNTTNQDQQQIDNSRASTSHFDSSIGNYSPSNSGPVATTSVKTRVSFDVDAVSSLSDAMTNQFHGTLLESFVLTAMQLDQAASPGTNTAMYVDGNGRTRLNQLSATTLLLMMYEVFCDLAARYASADFTTSEQSNTVDMLVDQQFNTTNIDIINSAINEADTVITPTIIGTVGMANVATTKQSAMTTTGGTTLALGAGSLVSPSSPGTVTVDHPGGSRLSDTALQVNPSVSIQRIAQQIGVSTGQVQTGQASTQQYTGNQNVTTSTRTSVSPLYALFAGNPAALLALRNQENSLFSIKRKIYEEDLIVANILHILFVVYTRLANAKERMLTYFTQATLTNFLNQSHTATSDLVNLLSPAQTKIIVATRDSTTRDLQASGDVRGGSLGGGVDVNGNRFGVGFVSNTPNSAEVRNSILSLLSQPNYQEGNLADEKVKLLTIGIPSGFSRNLADQVTSTAINQTTFTTNKEFDVVEVLVHKRNLEHEELVFKPQRFIFDLSLFQAGFQNLNIAPNEDFNNVIQKLSLLDYASVVTPQPHTLGDINNDQKYGFLTDTDRHSMFVNHVTSDLLSSYISYMTAMKLTDETFVDINSDTYGNLAPVTSAVPAAFDPLGAITQDFQNKVIVFLNTVKHKNLPNRSFQDLLNDNSGLVDQETKDILRMISFGNVVFNPDTYMQRLLSPKLFDRVFTIPVSVDGFPIDVDMTNSTVVGKQALNALQQTPGAVTVPDSLGEIYLAPRDKTSPVFEDYFITVDLVNT